MRSHCFFVAVPLTALAHLQAFFERLQRSQKTTEPGTAACHGQQFAHGPGNRYAFLLLSQVLLLLLEGSDQQHT